MCVRDLTWVMVVSSTGEYRWWVGRAGQGLGKCCPKVRDAGAAGNSDRVETAENLTLSVASERLQI